MNLSELKALAEKATPGPWPQEGYAKNYVLGPFFAKGPNATYEQSARDAYFIAAANPSTVLKLIEAIEILIPALEFYSAHYVDMPGPEYEVDRIVGRKALAKVERILG